MNTDMNSQPLTASVVICCHTEKRWPHLVQAIESALAQRQPAHEIVVVVDHNPVLLARVRQHFPSVTTVENSEGRGASGAKNTGIAASHGSIIAFLDDDAIAAPDWLMALLPAFDNPNVLGVGGWTLPAWESGVEPRWFPQEFYWVFGCTHKGMPETAAPVRNLIACNMAVRRKVFDRFGGFRTTMGPNGKRALGCEETEFCIRVGQSVPNGIWLHQPSAIVRHQVPASRATWRYLIRRSYGEGLSKALVVRFVGSQTGLAAERAHVLKTLPRGMAAGVGAALKGDASGMGRALAIPAGLAATAFGFVRGNLALRLRPAPDLPDAPPSAQPASSGHA